MPGETIEAIQGILDHHYTADEALRWLRTPHPQLDGRRPLDLLIGRREPEVLAVLQRLRDDVYL